MGRASAVKAKVDGYNAMLAALKRGKTFQNPDSTAWVLEPADTVDIMPTLSAMIGLPVAPGSIDGHCMSGVLGISCPASTTTGSERGR